MSGPSRDPRTVWHYHLKEFETLTGHTGMFLGTGIVEPGQPEELFDGLRSAF